MEENIIKIADNKFLHVLNTNKFKTSFVVAFFLSDLNREDITINALIPAVLNRGTANLNTMKDINLKLDSLYGATLDGSSDKIGDKQALQFYVTTIDDKYALDNENLLEESVKLLLDVIYHPKLVNGLFDEKYVRTEKENLKELIKSRINDKSSYAISRLIEEMYQDSPYGAYKYGNVEDLEKIDAKSLYEQYTKIIANSELHFYVCSSTKVDESWFDICKVDTTKDITPLKFNTNSTPGEKHIMERQDVIQGKLVLGYDVDIKKEDLYKAQVYNAILGGSSNSKMFQNVREKESLAYTARSTYLKHKQTLLLFAGIEIDKYEKALETMKVQVEDMKQGKFSDEDIRDAKVFLENIIRSYNDSQDILIDLSMGQIVMGMHDSIDEMIQKINEVTREDVLYVANKIKFNTEYFLTANNSSDEQSSLIE